MSVSLCWKRGCSPDGDGPGMGPCFSGHPLGEVKGATRCATQDAQRGSRGPYSVGRFVEGHGVDCRVIHEGRS